MSPQRNHFTEWLNFHPSIEEIARAVATEYLSEFSVLGVRISQSNSDKSLLLLGQFGYTEAEQEARAAFPDAELKLLASPDLTIINDGHKIQWDPSGTYFVAALRDRGVTHGFLVIEFKTTVPDSDRIAITERIDSFASTISLYLSFKDRAKQINTSRIKAMDESLQSGPGQLSARQLSILRGMVEGKTNHELATDLGFSVSTVRHETMRIFQALAVSDRKEAAKKGLALGII